MLTACTEEIAYVEAVDAIRGVGYRCRGCCADVVLKAGQLRIAHFAHKPDSECAFGAKMSLAHLTAQRRIAEALRARGVNCELEAFMPSLAGDRRIDVLAWPSDRPASRIAIEVQASDMTTQLVAARTRSYNAEGVAPLWLRLLDFGVFDMVQALPQRGTLWIEKYRARAWERWAHDQLGGRLWFLDQGTGLTWRGTFVPAHSYREVSTWYGSGGEEQSAGGDWRDIVQWVDLEMEGPFELASLRFSRGHVKGADAARRLGGWFLAPCEDARPMAPFVRAEFKLDHQRVQRELQVEVASRWIPAGMRDAPTNWRTGHAVR